MKSQRKGNASSEKSTTQVGHLAPVGFWGSYTEWLHLNRTHPGLIRRLEC